MKPFLRLLALSVATGTLLAPAGNARAQLLITGNDEKVSFDETGKTVTHPPGKDTVSITGPRVSLAITLDQHLALVANPLDWVKDGEACKVAPDNKRPEGFQVQR